MPEYKNTRNVLPPLPKVVRIGPVDFDVEVVDTLEEVDDKGRVTTFFGKIIYAECKVYILGSLKPIMQWQCLWHEIMHAVNDQLGLKNNEGLVDSVAYKILDIVLDNGWLKFPSMESIDGEED